MVLPSSKLANIQTCYFYKPASSKLKTVAKKHVACFTNKQWVVLTYTYAKTYL